MELAPSIVDAPLESPEQADSRQPIALEPPPRARTATIGLIVGFAFASAVALAVRLGLPTPHELMIFGLPLCGAALVGARGHIRISQSLEINGMFIPLITAAVVSPEITPLVALVVAAAPMPSRSVRALNTGYAVCGGSAAALGLGLLPAADSTGSIIMSTCVGGLVSLLTNLALLYFYEGFVWRTRFRDFAPSALGTIVATSLFTFPVVGGIGAAIITLGPVALPLVLTPLAVAVYFHSLYHRKVELTDELAEKAQILARTNLQFAAAMVRALDTRDAYTAGHSAAVAVYTRDIAREMGFDDETVRVAHLAGLLHDIGKIGVPGRVLNKQAPLDDEEYELMKTHAAMGAEILGEVDLYKDIAVLVRYHHERMDGRGYPDQLEGEAIPAISRMISVADTYSAMTTDRPYRDGMPTEKAMSILRECRGTQLDADFTDAFLRILIVADEAYQRGKQTDFEVEVAKHQALSEVEAEAIRVNAPSPAGPPAPAAPVVPVLPAAVDGELVEVDLEREAA